MTTAIMLMGTCSNAGKSLLAAGICRALTRRGLRVRPFKPQNMSNNAAVTADGGEIGRAQALQARACRTPPSTDMNPLLLKPQSDCGAQVILRGCLHDTLDAAEFHRRAKEFLPVILGSYRNLQAQADIIVIEGAGSPAEANLRRNDIANMGFAQAANVPAVLIGDIDRGGVLASVVGTTSLLDAKDRARLRGFIVNRFRGDANLFAEGMEIIRKHSGLAPLGLVPFLPEAARLPAEDSLNLDSSTSVALAGNGTGIDAGTGGGNPIRIAVPRLQRMANFDDFDPLLAEADVSLVFVPAGEPLPGDADAVILPGSKSTRADMAFLRAQGWDIDILAHWRRGGHVLGICAGYQMLGERIVDDTGIEGEAGASAGLGLLPAETVLRPFKTLQEVHGKEIASGCEVRGYEMHIGETGATEAESDAESLRPMFSLHSPSRLHGAVSADGRVSGCYLHGLFAQDAFRHAWLQRLGHRAAGNLVYERRIEETLDLLGEHIESHIALDRLLEIAAEQRR